jgi:hypothetical protein
MGLQGTLSKRVLKRIAPSCLAIFWWTGAWGQSATTSLRGTISDSQGGLLPAASVSISNAATNFSRSTRSDSQGAYQFQELPPATYDVTVSAGGFATMRTSGLALLVNTPAALNFSLKIAGVQTVVEVASGAPLVNSQDATLGHAFSASQITTLPFEGRDPTGILSLQPGVVFTGNNPAIDANTDSRSGAVSGARSDQTNITIDGVDNNDSLNGFAFQGALRATLDSLEEFRVTTTGGNADEGHSSGAQVVLVTRSGTNSFHGSLYEYHRPTFTTANDWFVKQAQLASGERNRPGLLIRNTFGAAVGGPAIHDRMFFFATYEGQRLRENTGITRVVPSDNLRQGIVSYQCSQGSTNCPASGLETLTALQLGDLDPNCVTLGTCPLGQGANPAVLSLFQQYPHPNSTAVGDGYNFQGYTFSGPAPAKLDTYLLKLDYNLTRSGNHHLFLRGNLQNDRVSGTGPDGPQFPGSPSNVVQLSNNKGIALGYTAVLRSNLIEDFRYGFIRQGIDLAGLQNSHYVQFDQMDNLDGENPSTRLQIPAHNFVDSVTWSKGRHTLQFGASVRLVNDVSQTNQNSYFSAQSNADWLFASGIANTGQSLDPGAPQFSAFHLPAVAAGFASGYSYPVAALTGLLPYIVGNYNFNQNLSAIPEGSFLSRDFRARESEWYAQDAFQLRPDLTLTLGLRYSLLPAPYETSGTQVCPTTSLDRWFQERGQAASQGQVYEPLVGFNLCGKANGGAPFWTTNYNNFAPRLAFAWSPNFAQPVLRALTGGRGKFSLRGGYGIYFDHFGESVVRTYNSTGAFGLSASKVLGPGTFNTDTSPRFSALNTIPVTAITGCATPPTCPAVPPAPSGTFPLYPPNTQAAGGFAISEGIDDKLKTPYSQVMSFSVTRELPREWTLEIAYVGRLGHHLLVQEDVATPVNLRDPKSGTDYFTAARMLEQAALNKVDVNTFGKNPIPYWQNVFPQAAAARVARPSATIGFSAACAPGIYPSNPNATQQMYDLFSCFAPNATTDLFFADLPYGGAGAGPGGCVPACATLAGVTAPYSFWDPQWSSLYTWRSVGNSAYNGLQMSLRKHVSSSLMLDFNYTFSRSIDIGSAAERIDGGTAFVNRIPSQIINAWKPNQLRAVSDFDSPHQVSADWTYHLPFGRGQTYGSGLGSVGNALAGGWDFTGLLRWSNAYPFTVNSGRADWSVDWQLPSEAIEVAPVKTGSFVVNGQPNVFQNGTAATGAFRSALAGESGERNNLWGPGTFDIDAGFGKRWPLAEGKTLGFRWETYNVTNTPRFDVGQMMVQDNTSLVNTGSFGNFSSTLSKPRLMQFALRIEF